jgi:hypothetical protein
MDPVKQINPLASLDALEWKESLTGSLIRFGILTALFIGILIAFIATGNVKSVSDNWSRYRCSPFIMPFAELFGYDSAQNFQFCVRSMMQSQSGEMFQPVYNLLGQQGASLGIVINAINGFRNTLGKFKLSADGFLNGVMSKFQALLFQIRIMFMRMQTLMGRVYGTMYSLIWMGTSAITAGTSLAENDLVNFMFEFCFAPTTRIRMQDGSSRMIQDIQIGDILWGDVRVTSTFRFKGDRTPMVQIGPDVLSAEHQVFEGEWIPAHQHSAALPTSSLPLLICLNVTGHAFVTEAGLRVADYDESSHPVAVAAAQEVAERALNGGCTGKTVSDYSLGFDPAAEIWMSDRTWKPANLLRLGDRVYGGAEVLGLVQEWTQTARNYGGVLVSDAQLVYVDCLWKRAADLEHADVAFAPLMQCVTDRAAPLFLRNPAHKAPIIVRDYREAPIPDMEIPYLAALEEKI